MALVAVVAIVCRLVSNQILRAELLRDSVKGSLQRQHVTGEQRSSAGFIAESGELSVCFILHLSCFNSGHRRRKTCLGGNRVDGRLGSLRDIDRVAQIGAAIGILAVSDHYERAASLRRTHLLVTELPDGVVKRRLFAGFL